MSAPDTRDPVLDMDDGTKLRVLEDLYREVEDAVHKAVKEADEADRKVKLGTLRMAALNTAMSDLSARMKKL